MLTRSEVASWTNGGGEIRGLDNWGAVADRLGSDFDNGATPTGTSNGARKSGDEQMDFVTGSTGSESLADVGVCRYGGDHGYFATVLSTHRLRRAIAIDTPRLV